MPQEQKGHDIQMKDRRQLNITGVSEVLSFEEDAVVLQTAMGMLTVQGQQLQMKNLSQEGGQMSVEGTIHALIYEDSRQDRSWWQRLLG